MPTTSPVHKCPVRPWFCGTGDNLHFGLRETKYTKGGGGIAIIVIIYLSCKEVSHDMVKVAYNTVPFLLAVKSFLFIAGIKIFLMEISNLFYQISPILRVEATRISITFGQISGFVLLQKTFLHLPNND